MERVEAAVISLHRGLRSHSNRTSTTATLSLWPHLLTAASVWSGLLVVRLRNIPCAAVQRTILEENPLSWTQPSEDMERLSRDNLLPKLRASASSWLSGPRNAIIGTIKKLGRPVVHAFFTAITLCLPLRSLVLRRWRYWKLEPEERQAPCGHSLCQPTPVVKMQIRTALGAASFMCSSDASSMPLLRDGSIVDLVQHADKNHPPHKWGLQRSDHRPLVWLWVRGSGDPVQHN